MTAAPCVTPLARAPPDLRSLRIGESVILCGAALLQLLTLPISASLLARARYHASGIPSRVDTIDELADRPSE